jgi:hypothetical protein
LGKVQNVGSFGLVISRFAHAMAKGESAVMNAMIEYV